MELSAGKQELLKRRMNLASRCVMQVRLQSPDVDIPPLVCVCTCNYCTCSDCIASSGQKILVPSPCAVQDQQDVCRQVEVMPELSVEVALSAHS